MTNPAATQSKDIDCLSPEAQRLAEARLAAKRAARAEAREIRMKELERQQKEIYQVQKKYYGLDTKWGDIEQWMEDSERYSRRPRRNTSASDEEEHLSAGGRGSLRTNGYDAEVYGPQPLTRGPGRNSSYSGDGRSRTWSSSKEETLPSYLHSAARPAGSYRPSEHGGHLNSSSRASSRASSARASPVVEERPEKDFTEKGSRSLPGLSAAMLASLGGTSSRRGSGDTSISIDTEASVREIKELSELKDQIQDVEGKYMQGLKEMKDSLAEVEEKYKKAMVSNAQLDNEKTNFMYQVDTLKDTLLELEEQLAESRRQYEEKSKELEREKHAHSLLQFQFAEVRAALQQREEMLEEIRQLRQKQASYVREVSDLQETIAWKDKRIGALERQKEFFDSIRSERDDLREEVAKLKEEIKKHGILLSSERATNGETSDTLNNVGHQGPTMVTKEELNVLKATGDGTLGRAHEVEVKNEIVESVGQGEILQNTEQEPPREDPGKDCVDTEVFRAGENAEDQETSEDTAPSPGPLANATDEEQVQSQSLDSSSFLEQTEQVGSAEVRSAPDGRTGAPREQSRRLGDLASESPGPGIGQAPGDASDPRKQRESAGGREKHDTETSAGEVSAAPRPDSVPRPVPDVERVSSTDPEEPCGSPTQGGAEAGLTGSGEQVDTVAPGPPGCSSDTVSCEDECVVGVPRELDRSAGLGLEEAPTSQDVAKPGEAPVQSTGVGGDSDDGDEGGEPGDGTPPAQRHVQTAPTSPAAHGSAQEATGPQGSSAQGTPLGTKEPSEAKKDQQGQAWDSSAKKTKSKKKKNKKKKSPAPVETIQDIERESPCQNPDLRGVQEEEQGRPADSKPGVGTRSEVAENPAQETVAGGGENVACPENPKPEVDGKHSQEDDGVDPKAGRAVAGGDPWRLESATSEASGAHARDEGSDESDGNDNAREDGATPSRPPEPGDEEVSSRALLGNGGPPQDGHDAPQTRGVEGRATSENPSERVRQVLDSISLEDDALAPAGELGDLNSESREEASVRCDKDKSKEDCTLS